MSNVFDDVSKLYNSSFLHQTTTAQMSNEYNSGCIILLFYIKPQLYLLARVLHVCCIILLFYIKPQPQLDKQIEQQCCIILLFYIKPQLEIIAAALVASCIILLFYIKPQPYGV